MFRAVALTLLAAGSLAAQPGPNTFFGHSDFCVASDATIITRYGRDIGGSFQSLVEIRTRQTSHESGDDIGRGAIRLLDTVDLFPRTFEIGYYDFGVGFFANELVEFWTNGVSIARGPLSPNAGFLAVRDYDDNNDIRLRHEGMEGVIETTGITPGGIRVSANGPVRIEVDEVDTFEVNSAGVRISGGFTSGTGLQHLRVTSCTTAATVNATCDTVVTFETPFADTNYTVVATLSSASGTPFVLSTSAKTATSVTVTIATLAAVASSGTLNVLAVHD